MNESVIEGLPKRRLATVPAPPSAAPSLRPDQKPVLAEGICALCGAPSSASRINFVHERTAAGERVELDIELCEACGERLEKHLKRAIPKRLMTFTAIVAPPNA